MKYAAWRRWAASRWVSSSFLAAKARTRSCQYSRSAVSSYSSRLAAASASSISPAPTPTPSPPREITRVGEGSKATPASRVKDVGMMDKAAHAVCSVALKALQLRSNTPFISSPSRLSGSAFSSRRYSLAGFERCVLRNAPAMRRACGKYPHALATSPASVSLRRGQKPLSKFTASAGRRVFNRAGWPTLRLLREVTIMAQPGGGRRRSTCASSLASSKISRARLPCKAWAYNAHNPPSSSGSLASG